MDKLLIPEKENKTKRLFIPVTPTEHEKIKKACKKYNTTVTGLIRFALKQLIDF